jgi:uncharacterized iron-regulated membrane protein
MADKVDQLKHLTRMLEDGQITQSEFDSLKSELLAGQAAPTGDKPAGWYQIQSGQTHYEAWWDGHGWTGATRTGPTASKPRKPATKRLGFWLLMFFVVMPMVATVALVVVAAAAGLGVAASAESPAGPTASESRTTTTTTPRPRTTTTTTPGATTATKPRPVTTYDTMESEVAAALERWQGNYDDALEDVWDTTNCEDLAFDVQFAMDFLRFPDQAEADRFTNDMAMVAAARAELINCTLNIN